MALYYLYPDGTTSAGTWVPTGAASIHLAIDDLQGAPDDDTTYAQGSSATWNDAIGTFANMVDAVEITQVKLVVRHAKAGGAGSGQELDFGIRIGSTNYLNGSISPGAAYAENSKTWTTNPATSAAWTKPQLDDLSWIVRTQDTVPATDSVRVTQVYLEVTYQPIPAGIAAARGVGSHRLRRFRRPVEVVSLDQHLAFLDLELMDDFSITHFAGPQAQGLGWGAINWKRQLHQKRTEVLDLNGLFLNVTSWGRRGFPCGFWDTAESRRSASPAEDGRARLTTGGAVTYARNSHAWIEDPGSQLVVQIGINQMPLARGGMLLENFASNYLQHSSCTEGATSVAGLTLSGTGINGSSITAEASPPSPLFDGSVSGYAYKFLAGTPMTTDLRATWPATATIPANTKVRVSIDRMDTAGPSGNRLLWRLQRAIDGNYWNNGTQAWQAGAVDNAMPLVSTRDRYLSNRIPIGGTGTTVTFSIVTQGGVGNDGRISRVYHAQLEDNYWMTSRVVTTASTYARAIQSYHVENVSGKRCISPVSGTFLTKITPEWDAADMNAYGGFPALLDMTYDASNWIRLYYNSGAPNRLDLEMRAAGVTYVATAPWTPVRGTIYKIAARWTSTAGELGLAARTLSVFVDGVKGTDGTRAADPTESSVDCYWGGDSVGNAVNGNMAPILCVPEVYTDEEIARFIA